MLMLSEKKKSGQQSVDVKHNYVTHIRRKVLETHQSFIVVVLDYTVSIFFIILFCNFQIF